MIDFQPRGLIEAIVRDSELPFSLLVEDRDETRRILEAASTDEDVLFLEVLNPAGRRICALGRADRIKAIPALPAGASLEKRAASPSIGGERFLEVRAPVLAPERDGLLDWEPAREPLPTRRSAPGPLHAEAALFFPPHVARRPAHNSA